MVTSPDAMLSLNKQAKKAFEHGEYEKASALYTELYQTCEKNGDEVNSAENKNNCSVCYLKAESPQQALDIVEGTDLVFAERGDKKRQAMAIGNRAAALEALGKLDLAYADYQKASLILKEINDQEMRPYILKSLSALEIRRGDYLQSLATAKASIDSQNKISIREKFLRKLLGLIFKD